MRPHAKWVVLLVTAILAGAVGSASAFPFIGKKPAGRDYGYFLGQLTDLDRLPFLEPGVTCKQFSSYDRRSRYDEKTGEYLNWDANGDSGNYLRVEPNNEAVLAEMNGPGCIYRIWSANPTGEIRVYLDGAAEPTFAIPFADLFSGALGKGYPFMPPLVWQRLDDKGNARASQCYAPIPYAKSCKVTVYPLQKRMYYHIGYQTFAPNTKVETFRLPLSAGEITAVERARKVLRNAFDASTMGTPAGKAEVGKSIDKKDTVPGDPQPRLLQRRRSVGTRIEPGQQAIVAEINGPAMITKLMAQWTSDDPQAYRTILLRVYWDGEERPSIETPLGDFFGSSLGPAIYHSLPMGRTSKWAYCYWRMPFRKRARIYVINQSEKPAEVNVELAWRKMPLPEITAYFHARWRRDPVSKEFDYPFLECTGQGRFVGAAQFVQNLAGGWWGEGDEKVYVDGEKFPSTFGTGSEDYYGDAWGIRWFSNPYAGCPLTSNAKGPSGQLQSCYRWHLSDFIPFEKSLKITIENYSAKSGAEKAKNDYSSVAYWYQMPGGTDFFSYSDVKDRLVRGAPKP